jgi:hypothetical protein
MTNTRVLVLIAVSVFLVRGVVFLVYPQDGPHVQNWNPDALGSAISIILLYSMNPNGLDVNFSKALSNEFNRLGGKWANRW